MLEKKLTNVLFNFTSLLRKRNRLLSKDRNRLLPRKENGLCVSDKKIESEYDEIKRAKDVDYEREDKNRERENGDCEEEDRELEREDIDYKG